MMEKLDKLTVQFVETCDGSRSKAYTGTELETLEMLREAMVRRQAEIDKYHENDDPEKVIIPAYEDGQMTMVLVVCHFTWDNEEQTHLFDISQMPLMRMDKFINILETRNG